VKNKRPNNRQKGKRIERWFKNELKFLFPDIQRNANGQSQSGGFDLINTPGFAFECKGGKAYKSAMIRNIIDQMEQDEVGEYTIGLVKPDREKSYAIIPWDDFISIMKELNA